MLQTYWMLPVSIQDGPATVNTPSIPANKGIRSYSVMTKFVALTDNAGGAASQISSFSQGGVTHPGGSDGIAEGPGVTQVTANYLAFSAAADFLFITDIFE